MVRNIRLKDNTMIRETQKGVFAIIFPNRRYILCTTWENKIKISIPTIGDFEL